MTVENEDAKLTLHRSVVLVGMMGSGKTAIGRALASKLNVPFLDSDAEIVEAAQTSIAEIFERDGEAFFRKREAEVIERLISGEPCILSTGGGAFMSEGNRKTIEEKGVSVWLNADLDLLWERVRHKDTRPLLCTTDPYQTLSQIFAERTPVYQKAVLSLPVQDGASIDETTDQTISLLLTRPEILERME
ncbi:shikimate kinase [Cognatiyoonia sp.]|uniref:shikimate kinase n=1 Tax=Cognatiyoonia sp. TaxID=2211652 RepID=UPI003F69C573